MVFPKDNSATKNGKKWIIRAFETDNKTGSVFIQIWNKYPQEKSTMLIQAEKCHLSLSIAFFQSEIPKLFHEVLKVQPSSLGFHPDGSKSSGSGSFNKVTEVTCNLLSHLLLILIITI